MNRMPIPSLMLAILLALLLPLEQAHCVWMGLQSQGVRQSSTLGGHACCAKASSSRNAPGEQRKTSPAACTCIQLPPVTLPSLDAPIGGAPVVAMLMLFSIEWSAPRSTDSVESVSHSGSPPLPVRPRSHGLRAPPILA